MSDLLDRFFSAVRVPPYQVGVGIAFGLLVGMVGLAVWTGQIHELLQSDAPLAIRDARLAVVISAFVGFTVAARRYATLGARRELEGLLPKLREDPNGRAALERALAPLELRRAGWVALLIVPLTALAVDRDPELYLRADYWSAPHVGNWLIGGIACWNAGRLAGTVVQYARRFSALARGLGRLDLFDLAILAPFARQGLRSALLSLIMISILSLNAVDSGFAWFVAFVGGWGLLLAGVALLLPTLGARERVRRAKREELSRVDAAIRGEPAALADSAIGKRAATASLADLLAYRAHVDSVHEWPFDAPTLLRFGLFALLPIGSWLGGALVERAVGTLLD